LGAISIVRFPEGVLTVQARRLRAIMGQIHGSSPQLYLRLKVGGAAGLVVVVALVIAVRNMWWLWLVIGLVLITVAFGYVTYKNRQPPTAALVGADESTQPGILKAVDVG
jgi:hypothetical protein